MTVPMVVITIVLGFMSLMGTIIGFFCVRTLSRIDKNQEQLWKRVDGMYEDLSWLKGQHELLACRKIT